LPGRSAGFERFLGTDHNACFRDREIAVLGINTARSLTFKEGRISFAQMEQIVRAFAADGNAVLKVVVIHHPLAPPEGSPGLGRVGRWRPALAALRQAGVHLVLSGHHHHGFSGELEMPTGGGGRRAGGACRPPRCRPARAARSRTPTT